MQYLVYGRVSPRGSTWEGSETSIPDQIAECKAYVLARDPSATFIVIEDEFYSAGSAKRPGYQRIVQALKAGIAEWDVVVVRHIDRLSRSLVDAIKILELLKQYNKGLISTTQHLDMSTPTGRAMLHIICIFGQWEREMGGERVKMKMVSIAKGGGWPCGIVPIGYVRPEKRCNVLAIDARGAQKVRGIFSDYIRGDGAKVIAERYGVRNKQQVWWILKNPIYRGVIMYDGEMYKGKHEAIIDVDTWTQVESQIGGRTSQRPKGRKYPYVLAGKIYCQCGRYLTPTSAHGRSKRYHYYSCTDAINCKTRVRAEGVEDLVMDKLNGLEFSKADIDEIKRLVGEYFRGMNNVSSGELDEVRTAWRDASGELDRIKALFISGVVTKDNAAIFNDELSRARDEVNRLSGKRDAMETLASPDTAALHQVESFVDTFVSLRKALVDADDPDLVRMAVQTYIRAIIQTADGWDIQLSFDGSSNDKLWHGGQVGKEPRRMRIRIVGGEVSVAC